MIKPNCPNINLLWGKLLIEELYRLGVTHFCIAPGSRSTALTMAVQQHPKAVSHCHFDERGLGFFALGLAKSTKQVTAIIVTSGTAVANLHPAIIEAFQTNTPLVVLSADRPDELINCGANQAINQQNIFGSAVVEQLTLCAPTTDISPSYVLTSIDHAMARLQNRQGPIHINCMFREPFYASNNDVDFSEYLAPINRWLTKDSPYTLTHRNETILPYSELFKSLIDNRVMIVLGQLPSDTNMDKIIAIAEKHQWPILADCQSSLPKTKQSIHYYDQLLHVDAFQKELQNAEYILQIGGRLISKRLLNAIAQSTAEYWFVDNTDARLDPDHRIKHRFSHINSFINVLGQLPIRNHTFDHQPSQPAWLNTLQVMNSQVAQKLEEFDSSLTESLAISEYQIIRNLLTYLPDESSLFLGNSMPIRLFDMYTRQSDKIIDIYTNRGASGIDGIIATTAGMATATNIDQEQKKPTTLVIGDTSFLHDLNSLALIAKINSPLVILVFNNDGGAIFNMLPVSDADNLREEFYQMPHGLTFAKACELFSIQYHDVDNLQVLDQTLSHAYQQNHPSLIEVIVPANQTTDIVKNLGALLNANAV